MSIPVTKGIASASTDLNGSGLHICIIRTQWNAAIIDALTAGASSELARLNAKVCILEVSVLTNSEVTERLSSF